MPKKMSHNFLQCQFFSTQLHTESILQWVDHSETHCAGIVSAHWDYCALCSWIPVWQSPCFGESGLAKMLHSCCFFFGFFLHLWKTHNLYVGMERRALRSCDSVPPISFATLFVCLFVCLPWLVLLSVPTKCCKTVLKLSPWSHLCSSPCSQTT